MFLEKRNTIKNILEENLYKSIINNLLSESIEDNLDDIKHLEYSNIQEASYITFSKTLNILEDISMSSYNINNLDTFKSSIDLSAFEQIPYTFNTDLNNDLTTTADLLLQTLLQDNGSNYNQLSESETMKGITVDSIKENLVPVIEKLKNTSEMLLNKIVFIYNNRLLKLNKNMYEDKYIDIIERSKNIYKEMHIGFEAINGFIQDLSFDVIQNKECLKEVIACFRDLYMRMTSLTIFFYTLKLFLSGVDKVNPIGSLYNDNSINDKSIPSLTPFIRPSGIQGANKELQLLLNNLSNDFVLHNDIKEILSVADNSVCDALKYIFNNDSGLDNIYTRSSYKPMYSKRMHLAVKYYHNYDILFRTAIESMEALLKLLSLISDLPLNGLINNEKIESMKAVFDNFYQANLELDNDLYSIIVNKI